MANDETQIVQFNGTEGAPIELELAKTWTSNYRKQFTGTIKALFFGKDILQNIMNQEGCMGIRFYNALDEAGMQKLVIVGANAAGEDMCDGIVADYAVPCPNMCDTTSPLNS